MYGSYSSPMTLFNSFQEQKKYHRVYNVKIKIVIVYELVCHVGLLKCLVWCLCKIMHVMIHLIPTLIICCCLISALSYLFQEVSALSCREKSSTLKRTRQHLTICGLNKIEGGYTCRRYNLRQINDTSEFF